MPTITHLQMKELARNPSAYMRYQATGKLPPTVTPSSPLIDLLEAIPPRVRLRIRGVRLAPALGYQTARQFHTAEQLLKWLKPDQEMLQSRSWPAESYRIKRFTKRLIIDDLKPHCASWPNDELFKR
ncbi:MULTISPECIES: hypothetical protein [Halomonas]|uniref:hypothetical protein n=1 Tax=Halomonas TaxID=2745 RepID=UPI003CE6BDAA